MFEFLKTVLLGIFSNWVVSAASEDKEKANPSRRSLKLTLIIFLALLALFLVFKQFNVISDGAEFILVLLPIASMLGGASVIFRSKEARAKRSKAIYEALHSASPVSDEVEKPMPSTTEPLEDTKRKTSLPTTTGAKKKHHNRKKKHRKKRK